MYFRRTPTFQALSLEIHWPYLPRTVFGFRSERKGHCNSCRRLYLFCTKLQMTPQKIQDIVSVCPWLWRCSWVEICANHSGGFELTGGNLTRVVRGIKHDWMGWDHHTRYRGGVIVKCKFEDLPGGSVRMSSRTFSHTWNRIPTTFRYFALLCQCLAFHLGSLFSPFLWKLRPVVKFFKFLVNVS